MANKSNTIWCKCFASFLESINLVAGASIVHLSHSFDINMKVDVRVGGC